MRKSLVVLHRWFGLFIAVFLFISGLTGAIISWDHELDEALNPELYKSEWQGQPLPALELADRLEAEREGIRVTYMPLEHEPGHTLNLFVEPTSAEAAERIDYNQLGINPTTGEIQAERMWGDVSLSRENLLPFLYKLHYSMHIPDIGNVEAGMWFMGIIGIVWLLDCFIALAISFPSRKNWKKSFHFRWKNGIKKLNFDLHRSGGVWLWGILLMVAVTSVSMNLEYELVRPMVNSVSPLTPNPFDTAEYQKYSSPGIDRASIVQRGLQEAQNQNIDAPLGGIFYSPDFDIYGVGFFTHEASHGDGGLGVPWLYFGGQTGEYLGATIPGTGSLGDIFMQAQFPLHSGRIIGVPGRAIMSFMGLVVAMLSLTGVIIWARKRRARIADTHKGETGSPRVAVEVAG